MKTYLRGKSNYYYYFLAKSMSGRGQPDLRYWIALFFTTGYSASKMNRDDEGNKMDFLNK